MRILVAKENHGDRYLDASTDEELGKSALKLLKERNALGWMYPEVNTLFGVLKEPDLSYDQAKALPDGEVQTMALRQWDSFQRKLQYREEYTRWYDRMKTAIRTDNGKLAWLCLQERRDYEYEKVRLEEVELNE